MTKLLKLEINEVFGTEFALVSNCVTNLTKVFHEKSFAKQMKLKMVCGFVLKINLKFLFLFYLKNLD